MKHLKYFALIICLLSACSPSKPASITELKECSFKLTILELSEMPFSVEVNKKIYEGETTIAHKATRITGYLEFKAQLPADVTVQINDQKFTTKRKLEFTNCDRLGLVVSSDQKYITAHKLEDYIFN